MSKSKAINTKNVIKLIKKLLTLIFWAAAVISIATLRQTTAIIKLWAINSELDKMLRTPCHHCDTFPTGWSRSSFSFPPKIILAFCKAKTSAKKIYSGIYLFRFSSGNTRAMRKICSKLTINTSERLHRHQWIRSSVFIANFELTSQIILVSQLLSLNKKMSTGVGLCNIFHKKSVKNIIETTTVQETP